MKSSEELKAENALLKLMLETEMGMKMEHSELEDAEIENQFLNNVYNFEREWQKGRRIKIYDRIGNPPYKKYAELDKKEIPAALENLQNILRENEIVLGTICKYDDDEIYRFITEELFSQEIDDITMEGMILHFIYEEFHPNHDYDLRTQTASFISRFLKRKWDPEYDGAKLAPAVKFNGKKYDRKSMSSIILAFQEAYKSFREKKLVIENVDFDLESKRGSVSFMLTYTAQPIHGEAITFSGKSTINFVQRWDFWCVSEIQLPGFGS
jgi:hypothetical protein